jgi:hypothetical protein
MSAEEAFTILLIFLNAADALSPQSRAQSHRVRACKIVAQVGGASGGELLPPESYLIEVRQLSPGMRKTSPYGVQRETAIVLLSAEPLLRGREHDLAIPGDCRSRIMGSVVDSECEHFPHPKLRYQTLTCAVRALTGTSIAKTYDDGPMEYQRLSGADDGVHESTSPQASITAILCQNCSTIF